MKLEKSTKIGELVEKYPEVKSFLKTLSPEYSNLDNPELFAMMKDIATLEMVAIKGGFEFDELKENLSIRHLDCSVSGTERSHKALCL